MMDRRAAVLMALMFLSLGHESAAQAPIYDMIAGHVFDSATGRGIDGLDVTVSGNVSGFLWNGTTTYNPFNPNVNLRHGEYSSGHTLNPGWFDGELLTAVVTNPAESGYNGSGQCIVPAAVDVINWLDIYALDVKAPEYLVAGSRHVNETGDVLVYSGWFDNSNGSLNVTVTHNATGSFVEHPCNLSGEEYVYAILKADLVKGERVAFYFTATDPSSNRNDTMPLNYFTYNPSTIEQVVPIYFGWNMISILLDMSYI